MTKIICLEGGDGAGKGTLIKKIEDYLNHKKIGVTNEPGSPHVPVCQELRKYILDSAYGFSTFQQERFLLDDRCAHLQDYIEKSYGELDFILQDRGILSSISYGVAKGGDIKDLLNKNREILHNIETEKPQFKNKLKDIFKFYDLLIYLDIDPEVGLNRAKNAKKEFEAGDVIENKGTSFQRKVRKNYLNFIKIFNNSLVVSVTDLNPEEVFEAVKKEIDKII